MTKLTNPTSETFKIKNSVCTKGKTGKIPPTYNIRHTGLKLKKRRRKGA